MKNSGNLYYTLSELNKLIEKTPEITSEKIVLIGGQALISWVHTFQINDFTDSAYDNLASDDLDFVGKKQAILECAQCWNGKVSFPGENDSTPQTGRIFLAQEDERGELMTVDFLGVAYGIPTEDVEKFSDRIDLGSGSFYRVISPPLCLLSRIKNITGYLKGADALIHQRETSRIQSAIAITRRYLEHLAQQDLSEKSDIRTKSVVNYLSKKIFDDKDTVTVAIKYDVNFDHIFPEVIAQVNSDIYSKMILRTREHFNKKVQQKIRSERIRTEQKVQKKARLEARALKEHN